MAIFYTPSTNYETAIELYYNNGPPPDWTERFISAYATSHPAEDWAETFAAFEGHVKEQASLFSSHAIHTAGIASCRPFQAKSGDLIYLLFRLTLNRNSYYK